jgi:hypothetical protein
MTRGSTTPGAQRAVSRRAVVRAGSTAAWAVPAISVATMTSGYAAVSGQAALQGSGFTVKCLADQQRVHVMIGSIKNTGSASTGGPVTVVMSAPEGSGTTMDTPYDRGVENNWTYAGQSGDSYTFVSKRGALKSNQSTGALGFWLGIPTESCPTGAYTYVATAPNSTSTAGSTQSTSAPSS